MQDFRIEPVIHLGRDQLDGGNLCWWPEGRPAEREALQALAEDPITALEVSAEQLLLALKLLERLPEPLWLSVVLPPALLPSMRGLFRALSRRVEDLEALRRCIGRRLVVGLQGDPGSGQELRGSPLLANLAELHTLTVRLGSTEEPVIPQLLALPFQRVSVTAALADGADSSEAQQRFLRWLVGACHAVAVPIAVGGVVTASKAALLRRLGVDLGHGPLWHPPLPPESFQTLAGEAGPCRTGAYRRLDELARVATDTDFR
ncbi:MAG: EAL domain-containing protein [Synechococcus sp.]|nr:EAL domain-containing protein [Synechococcus sp.]